MSRIRMPTPSTDAIEHRLLSAAGSLERAINGIVNAKTRDDALTELNFARRSLTALREAQTLLKEYRDTEKRLRAAVKHWHEQAKERAVT